MRNAAVHKNSWFLLILVLKYYKISVDPKFPFCYTIRTVSKQEFKLDIKRFKPSQKFRVIVDSACFYATARQIRSGLGDFTKCNAATQKALDALEYTRSGTGAADRAACGLAGTWEGLNVQLNLA